MNPDQQKTILTIALLAAFADVSRDDHKCEQICQLAESLGSNSIHL